MSCLRRTGVLISMTNNISKKCKIKKEVKETMEVKTETDQVVLGKVKCDVKIDVW